MVAIPTNSNVSYVDEGQLSGQVDMKLLETQPPVAKCIHSRVATPEQYSKGKRYEM